MNLSLFGLGAVVLSVGVITIAPAPSAIDVSVFQDRARTTAVPDDVLSAKLSLETSHTMRDVSNRLRDRAGGVHVDWGALDEIGIAADEPLGLSGELSIGSLFALLRDHYDVAGNRLDWRYENGLVRFDTSLNFDRRERTLASYDVQSILDHGVSEESLCDLLRTFVSPDDWTDNGGTLGTLQIVAGRLFVEAPPRMHERAQWILNELQKDAEVATARGRGVGRAGFAGGAVTGYGGGSATATGDAANDGRGAGGSGSASTRQDSRISGGGGGGHGR